MEREASEFGGTASDSFDAAGGTDDNEAEAPQGPHQTLRLVGPKASEGSGGHPDSCTPCTFFCFARRGCSRGAACQFCHLSHQSKLRLRREAWKEQQREKRRAARSHHDGGGGGAAEPPPPRQDSRGGHRPPPRPPGMAGGPHPEAGEDAQAIALFDLLSCEGARALAEASRPAPRERTDGEGVFSYRPGRATMAIGQVADFWPSVKWPVRRFSPVAPLPAGFSLNWTTGVITAAPTAQFSETTLVVQADLGDGRRLWGMLQVESVDFSVGGFFVGHMSEVAPGRYMMLLYVPEGDPARDGPRPPGSAVQNGAPPASKGRPGLHEAPPLQLQ